jgi:hypothetical protein
MSVLVQTKKYQYHFSKFLTDEESQEEKKRRRIRGKLDKSRQTKDIKKLAKKSGKNNKAKLMFLTDSSSEEEDSCFDVFVED